MMREQLSSKKTFLMKEEQKWTISLASKKLASRGCEIAHSKPVTRKVQFFEKPTKKNVAEKYIKYLRQRNLEPSDDNYEAFCKAHKDFIRGKRVNKSVVVLPAMSISIPRNALGIKLLGAVDFLKSKGYSVEK